MLWKLDHLVTVRPCVGRNISRKTQLVAGADLHFGWPLEPALT
jgi:hypothetical protein